MLRGYRLLIAAIGIATLCITFGLGSYVASLNDAQQERYQPYRHTTDNPPEVDPAAARPANAKSFEYRSPCEEPQSETESDLCAQWRAAKAAEFSAAWTKWGVIVGIIGSTLLLWQIILTREAVEDTGRATKAMERQNDLVAASQRPWVTFDAKVCAIGEGAYLLEYDLSIVNESDFPAHGVCAASQSFFTSYGFDWWDTALSQRSDVAALLNQSTEFGAGRVAFPRQPLRLSTGGIPSDPEGMFRGLVKNPDLMQVVVLIGIQYSFAGGVGSTIRCFLVENFGHTKRRMEEVKRGEVSDGKFIWPKISPHHLGDIAT